MIKGITYNLFARGLFVVGGYLIHISLGRHLGPKEYGIFGVILSLLTINEIFLTNGIRQAISKFTAENPKMTWSILQSGIKIQIALAVLIAGGYFTLSRQIATLLGDIDLNSYIKLSAMVIPFMGLCFVALGTLNGRKEFGKEAAVMSIYALLRVVLVLILTISLALRVTGAIWGFFGTALLASALGFFLVWRENQKIGTVSFPAKRIINFALPIVLFFLGVTLLMNIDLLFVKKFLSSQAAGFYTAAATFAKTPYFLFYAFSAIALPVITGSYTKGAKKKLKNQLKQISRYFALTIFPLTTIVSATSLPLIELFYSSEYLPAAQPLAILIVGVAFLSATVTFATIMMAIDKPQAATKIIFALVGMDFVLNCLLIPTYGLKGAALATTISSALGAVLTGAYVYSKLKALIEWDSLVKIILASIVIYLPTRIFAVTGLKLFGFYLLLGSLYLALLLLFREITAKEIEKAKELIKGVKI